MLDLDYCYGCWFVSLLPHSYHRLMVARYQSKREKFQVAKWWSTEERTPVYKLERAMDVNLFLEAQNQWAEDSPHCLVILYEMFWHAAIEGQKEVEWIVCQGHQQNLPHLDLEVGAPAIQLVGLDTTREQLLDIYLEVYKLHRPPGSLPGELAILDEIMATIPDHPPSGGNWTCEATAQPQPGSSHSPRSSTPHQQRDNSIDSSLATMHRVHQKALAAVATLEKEIKRLSHTWACSKSWARSKSQDYQRPSWEGWKKRHCQVWVCRWACPQPICQPQDTTRWRRVQGQRLWPGGTARAEADGSFLPARVTRNFRWWEQKDASRAHCLRFWPVGPMEGGEVWDPRVVGRTISSARIRRYPEASQGGERIP